MPLYAAAVLAAGLLLAGSGAGALAAARVERTQLVYDVQAFDGTTYNDAFYPQDQNTLYLLAGVPSAVVVARTRVYYWAPQAKELPDWAALDQPLAGTLEITGADGRTRALRPQPYILWFAQGGQTGPARLIAGRAALDTYVRYARAEATYSAAEQTYLVQEQRFQDELATYIAAVARRRRQHRPLSGLPVPRAPVAPVAPTASATAPTLAYLVDVPAGAYTLHVRGPNGRIVAGSARTLLAFTSRRTAIGYTAIPENRWTYPVNVDGGATLYLPGPGVLYVQPFAAAEYNDLDYTRLHEPQSTGGQPDGWTWVHRQPLSPRLTLAFRSEGGAGWGPEQRAAFRPYYVDQTSGSSLGYTIVPYSADRFPGEAPSFSAYRVPIGTDGVAEIQLIGAGGRAVPGSAGAIRVARTGTGAALFAPALLPLLVGLSILLWRDLRR